jgi:hypothetical protein
MQFNNPIPRSGLPRFNESSAQRSPRDSDATQRLWSKENTTSKQLQRTTEAVEHVQRQIARLRRRNTPPTEPGAYPFRIRRGDDWLHYIVGEGHIITTGNPLVVVTGLETPLAVTASVSKFYIYCEMTATAAEFKTAASAPLWDVTKIPIGWIDTLTNEADERGIITQFWKQNIFNPCVE